MVFQGFPWFPTGFPTIFIGFFRGFSPFGVYGPGRLEEFFLRLEVDPKAVHVCKHLVDERGTVDTLKLRLASSVLPFISIDFKYVQVL